MVHQAIILAHCAEIERCNQRGGRMLSIVDLIEAGTMTRELAAYSLAAIGAGASFMVGALPGGAGKTTVIWEKEVSEFPWQYDERKRCLFLEGDVVVPPKDGKPVHFGTGDFVTFPAGMTCTWQVLKAVRKHYMFG